MDAQFIDRQLEACRNMLQSNMGIDQTNYLLGKINGLKYARDAILQGKPFGFYSLVASFLAGFLVCLIL